MLNQPEHRPLRVLMVVARYFPYPQGGLMTHVYQVGRRLARMGVELTLLTTDVSGRLPPMEESEGIIIRRVRAWPTNKDFHFAPGIIPVIARGQWDLVHCQGYHNLVSPLAMFAAWKTNTPYILTIHSSGDVTGLRKLLRGLQRAVLRPPMLQAQKLIAVSQFEANSFRNQLRIPAERFVIISNGAAHLSDVPKPGERATNASRSGSLIVSIGRLVRYKGHQRVIAALPHVLAHVPDARLRIVGEGPYEATLQALAKSLGVADRVEIGPIPAGDWSAMASLITQADLVTLLSEHEGQGLAAMEALSLGRPVLVTNTTALQELVDHGLARGIPLESTPEEVAMAVVEQLRHPLLPINVVLPTWEDCAAHLLRVYQTSARRFHCVS